MKRLFIDLEKCYRCKDCVVKCDYYFHPENDGISSLLERISKAIVCRQCEAAPCVKACIFEALEKQPDGTLKRYNMRCTGCQTCSLACPFGVVYPRIAPYISSQCDFCLEQIRQGKSPACVEECPEGAVQFIEVEESEEDNVYLIGEHLAVHSVPWKKTGGKNK